MRNFEQFPTIEAFQNLPRRVIVKGGKTAVLDDGTQELSGIVINNLSQPIREVRVSLILFDAFEIPVYNVSAVPHPDQLERGAIASFTFRVDPHDGNIQNYYLYATWKYDDQ